MAEMKESQGQRRVATVFLEKTYKLVEDENNKNLISWTSDGAGIMIKDPDEFERILLPAHFKHGNLSSFVRQLNCYGFKKVSSDFWEFQHELFKKGDKHRLVEIKRKSTPSPAAESSNTGGEDQLAILPASDAEIVVENKRLKTENAALKQELRRFKSIFQHVAGLLNDLAGGDSGSAVPVDSGCGGMAEENQ